MSDLSASASPSVQGPSALIGIAVIGRNEGERLIRCLASVRGQGLVVYVDSGSTDGSVTQARELGAEVVELDMSKPFTAARARNAGFARLRELAPQVDFVQFVDGDCEVREGWLPAGADALSADPTVAVVCGRLRERFPERSIYNRMCDIGWDYPIGEIASCGGVAMYCSNRYAAAGGFNETLIAGEEFELCSRLRMANGRVIRIDEEMAWHDVGITRFSQWWRRAVRSGFSYAEGWALHARDVGHGHRRSAIRSVLWGIVLPAGVALGALGAFLMRPLGLIAVAVVVLYLVQLLRLTAAQRKRGRSPREAAGFGLFLVLAKLPEGQGACRYWLARVFHRRVRVIEYR